MLRLHIDLFCRYSSCRRHLLSLYCPCLIMGNEKWMRAVLCTFFQGLEINRVLCRIPFGRRLTTRCRFSFRSSHFLRQLECFTIYEIRDTVKLLLMLRYSCH
ncbi:hypothetical protein BT96DRAFT_724353 [Gymnopus androsaceus JB14]|uniref:Uncharacterized protein n=1 Tax=Gymnopus androsaceus JB14 TaxID=1447944 RepID=A0A6A4HJE6_9AGAR|nr:hypothetical protein BT96DRAFT_724353 [Gymnopus androsaceus JB14]